MASFATVSFDPSPLPNHYDWRWRTTRWTPMSVAARADATERVVRFFTAKLQ